MRRTPRTVLIIVAYALWACAAWRLPLLLGRRSGLSGGIAAAAVLLCTVDPSLAASYSSTESSKIPIYSFQYPDSAGLVISPKLVKTHADEVFLKSETIKGLTVGVTVDPVKIDNIRAFATPEGLADRVVAVERGKDGVFEANVVAAREAIPRTKSASVDSAVVLPAYEIEYTVDSSRGQNHYLVKATVVDKKLFVFTVQSKEDKFTPALKETALDIIGSFDVRGS